MFLRRMAVIVLWIILDLSDMRLEEGASFINCADSEDSLAT